MLPFLKSRAAKVLTLVLIMQAAAFYGLARTEERRDALPLSMFPKQLGGWQLVQEGTIEKEVQDVLKADDVITRWYVNPVEKQVASLFIAYFATQRTGKAPHSPKNCMPGSGWTQVESGEISIPVQGLAEPVNANRFIVQKGSERSLVVYFYQTRHRAIASEYRAKIYTVVDAIRYNRSDTALVRVTLPLRDGLDPDRATQVATRFVQTFHSSLAPLFPN